MKRELMYSEEKIKSRSFHKLCCSLYNDLMQPGKWKKYRLNANVSKNIALI